MGGNDTNVEPHKGNEDHVPVAYQTTNMSSDWQGNGNNLTNTSIGMIPMNNSMVQSSPSFTSAPMVDSFWDPSMNGQSLGYCEVNVQNVYVRAGGMDWNPNAMPRGASFLPHTVPGMLPQNLPQFPADSGFIERAARFSCFSGGNFGEMMNPFSLPVPYSRSLGPIVQGPHEVLAGSGSKSLSMTGVSNDVSLHGVCGTEGSPFKNEKKSESFVQSRDEAKHGANVSGNEPDEAEFSGRGAQEELDGAAGECSGQGLGSKKRKRNGQDMTEHYENNEAQQLSKDKAKETSEDKQKVDQNPTSSGKPGGKNGKQGSQGSDPPKEDYIHIRARRGQATNSHSLAERVRREKISERMKYLQDLVPGCSKVTGKAVMLDEIINYVQSLQRQVEFLSMKLATVNPRLDFNVEGFLAKDILQFRGGLSSPLAFHPDMTMPFPPQHQSQTGLLQASLPGLGNSSEALRRPINLQPSALCGGFKEHASQVPGSWEDELHNIVHMGGFGTTAALSSQDLSASLPPRHMKSEP